MDSLFFKRLINGLIIAVSIVVAEWFSPFIWFISVCLLVLFGNLELQKITDDKKYRHNYKLLTFLMLLLIIYTYAASNLTTIHDNIFDNIRSLINPNNSNLTIADWKNGKSQSITSTFSTYIGFIFILLTMINLRYTPRMSIGEISFSFLRIIYLGFFPAYIILLRAIPKGAEFLLLILVSGALCDIFAYFSGKAFGKTPFYPEISPKKTVEGAIGGASVCMLACFIGGTFLIGIPAYHAIIIGFFNAMVSQMGDLIESLLKRDVNKKDSGDLIPGHGGILDRVDSYIFISFPAYYYILYVIY